MRFLKIAFLMVITCLTIQCSRESCNGYKFSDSELRIIQDVDPVLTYINVDHSDTIKVIPQRSINQGRDAITRTWIDDGGPTCASQAYMHYSNITEPSFEVSFNLTKGIANAISFNGFEVAGIVLKKDYSDNRVSIYNNASYSLTYVGTLNFNGQQIEEVYQLNGTGVLVGNNYVYSLYEGLLRIEKQGKSWERIWQ